MPQQPMPGMPGQPSPGQLPFQEYSLILRSQHFHLSAQQIQSIPTPNFLADRFLTAPSTPGAEQQKSKTLYLDREPKIFPFILDWLNGYPSIPMTERDCPEGFSLERTLMYLHTDALLYGMKALERALRKILVDRGMLDNADREGSSTDSRRTSFVGSTRSSRR